MIREEKIKAIYKEMANKELTPWCCVEVKAQNEYGDFTYRLCRWDERPTTEIKEIIGHPVMIGDVFDYTKETKIDMVWSDSSCAIDVRDWEECINIFNLWEHKRKSIDDQTDECIDYVYSLIQKN